MQKKNKKKIVLLGMVLFSVFFFVIGGSYAFFSVIFQDTRNEENTSLTTDHLSNATIVYNIPNGVGSFLSTDIYPGHKEVLGISITGSGSVGSKSYFQFKYNVLENGLGNNVKISLYRNYKPIEITENYFNCIKKNEKIEGSNDTKYYETCEEKDLGLLIEETTLTEVSEEEVIGRDSLTILKENVDITKYYYVVAEEYLDGIRVDASLSRDEKSGIKKYYYKLNENEYIESTDSVYTYRGLSDGEYKVTVKIEDNAGNISEENSIDVVVAYQNVYVRNNGNDTTGNGSIDNPYSTIQRAYNKVKSGGNIILLSDITATETTNMNIENKSVTLKSNGTNKYSVNKSSNLTKQILYISNSNDLTINNIIFDGKNVESTGSLIEAYNSDVTLNSTTLQNNINIGRHYEEFDISASGGGGILVKDSTLIINSGTTIKNNQVTHSSVSHGGGIYAYNSTMELNNGTITGNKTLKASSKVGGGIALVARSTFSLVNGTISDNESVLGGGIFIDDTSMSMYGGLISNNIALSSEGSGGGIFASNHAQFDMSGGIIQNNTSNFLGGGIYVWESTFNIKYGTISYNTALDSGGGVWVCGKTSNSTMIMTNGQISNNTAKKYGGGLCIKKDASTIQVTAHLKGGTISNNTAPNGNPNTQALNGAQIINN